MTRPSWLVWIAVVVLLGLPGERTPVASAGGTPCGPCDCSTVCWDGSRACTGTYCSVTSVLDSAAINYLPFNIYRPDTGCEAECNVTIDQIPFSGTICNTAVAFNQIPWPISFKYSFGDCLSCDSDCPLPPDPPPSP